MILTMLQIIDTAITLVFYTIIAVAAVLVLGSFFWIIDTINRFWLRGKRYKSMFAASPRKRKRRWWWQAASHHSKPPAERGSPRTESEQPLRMRHGPDDGIKDKRPRHAQ